MSAIGDRSVPSKTRRVAIYRAPLLPISETFIRDQALAISRWRPTLVGETRFANRPDLTGIDTRALCNDTAAGRLARRLDHASELILGHSPGKLRLLESVRPDLVHVHFATDAVGLWPTVRRMGLPMVVTLHGYDMHVSDSWWERGHGGLRMRDYPSRLAAMSRDHRVHFIAVSEAMRRAALARGLPPERVTVRYTGVDVDAFAGTRAAPPSRRPACVLFVGRFVEKKGARYLIEAATLLRDRLPGLRWLFIGDGPEKNALASRARQLGIHAEFTGAQSHEVVRRALQSARVLCMPSVTARNGDAEGLGMVLLEAQAAGVPVVTSAIGGRLEGMIDRVTGFAFGERDVQHLAASVERLMRDDVLVDRMSRAATAFVRERFDIHACTRVLESFYDSVIEGARHRPSINEAPASPEESR